MRTIKGRNEGTKGGAARGGGVGGGRYIEEREIYTSSGRASLRPTSRGYVVWWLPPTAAAAACQLGCQSRAMGHPGAGSSGIMRCRATTAAAVNEEAPPPLAALGGGVVGACACAGDSRLRRFSCEMRRSNCSRWTSA